jgi:hypothetical protein
MQSSAAAASDFVYVGPRKVPVWPASQRLNRIDVNVFSTFFTDMGECRDALTRQILERAAAYRDVVPTTSRGLGGQKIYDMENWGVPEIDLITRRMLTLFRTVLNKPTASIERGWINVYQTHDYSMAHTHRRATASLVYFHDLGDDDGQDEMGSKFYFADARMKRCCPHKEGFMSHVFAPEVREGAFLMFPGWMVHLVSPYYGRRPRITFAWNVNEHPLPAQVEW